MAAGGLQDYLSDVWAGVVSDLLAQPSPGSNPLTGEERERITTDLEAAKGHITLQLMQKLSFWETLPWVVAGVAHTDQGRARKCAVKAIQCWQECADPRLHHRLTLKWFRDTVGFMANLARIVHGGSFEECDGTFKQIILELQWLPVIETTIEENTRAFLSTMGRCGRAQ